MKAFVSYDKDELFRILHLLLQLVDPVEAAVGERVADVGALRRGDLVVLDGGEGVDDVRAQVGVDVLCRRRRKTFYLRVTSSPAN
jgi:hypothetical protein